MSRIIDKSWTEQFDESKFKEILGSLPESCRPSRVDYLLQSTDPAKMRVAASNTDHYQRLHGRLLTSIWRRKWLGPVIALPSLFLFLLLTRDLFLVSNKIESSTEEATEKFYAEGEKWYNGKDISPADTKLWTNYLDDIRKNWIVWKYKSNMSYVLDAPEVTDPSMGQAKAIRNIFSNKKNGFFIECGAYDGETRSNTLVFERFYGWSGLLIEADPLNFSKMLQKNRKAYLSPTCLSIQPRPVVASFLMANNIGRLHEPENTTLENTHDVAHTGVHVKVQCFPLIHYLAALGVTVVDYFSLDVEGNEIDVLETIPFEQVDIKALSVEFSHNVKGRKYLITLMESKGYYVYSFVQRSDHLANDVIFVKRDT